MYTSLVSIIIPVYNAENLLDQCLNSLRRQTYPLLEIIFINDSSLDNSREVLSQFQLDMNHSGKIVHIINHEINKGVAAARNSGLKIATGEYIYFLDADDYLASECIECLLDEAVKKQADIVGCNWTLQFNKNGRAMIQPSVANSSQAFEFMCKGVMRWNLWLFFVKRELYVKFNIWFLPGENMGEDMLVMFKLIFHASRISMINKALYFYVQGNNESLTKTYSSKHRQEVTSNLFELDNYFKNIDDNFNWNILVNYLKLNIKLPLLISSYTPQYKEWRSWFIEANSYCLGNDLISKRIKLLQFMASKKQYWFIKLHYYLVIKLIYGVIYR